MFAQKTRRQMSRKQQKTSRQIMFLWLALGSEGEGGRTCEGRLGWVAFGVVEPVNAEKQQHHLHHRHHCCCSLMMMMMMMMMMMRVLVERLGEGEWRRPAEATQQLVALSDRRGRRRTFAH
jgi:hypothetical protein